MNEVFKPEVAERPAPVLPPGPSQPAPATGPETPAPRAGAASSPASPSCRGSRLRLCSPGRSSKRSRSRPTRESIRGGPGAAADGARRADHHRRHADHPRRARNGDAVRDRDHPHPDRRDPDGARLHRRPDGQEGRLHRPDRPQALPGRARPGAGPTRQGPGAARPGAERPRPLPDARQAGLDRQAAGLRPAGAGRAGQGGDPDRSGAGPDRPAQPRPTPASSRRSTGASASGSSTPATTCSRRTRPASSSSPRSTRSASIFSTAEDNLPRIAARLELRRDAFP